MPILSLLYITFRLVRPGWQLSTVHGNRLVFPVGLWGGIMQGASGISAPVSVTFLNVLRLERPVFIATISAFFAVTSVVQIPTPRPMLILLAIIALRLSWTAPT